MTEISQTRIELTHHELEKKRCPAISGVRV